jgi:DNA adenine methylase
MGDAYTPTTILDIAYSSASSHLEEPHVADIEAYELVNSVARNLQNRAGVRLLLAALLAKIHKPQVDIRKPYTEIGDPDAYSGRTYDERYVTAFIHKYELPCNPTTAFLTPALRNRNIVLTPDVNLVGRPATVYRAILQLLTKVHNREIGAEDLLAETVRQLIIFRNERNQRMQSLLSGLRSLDAELPLSAEGVVALVEQHLRFRQANTRGGSRLPVLVIAAAYSAASERLGEKHLPLASHNAADEQTGSIGDVEVTLISDNNVITSYEMKTRRVTREDIDRALQKIEPLAHTIHNYIFITTDVIDPLVQEYARFLYHQTGGIEFVVLDCIGFLRHFLHLFHRLRVQFLNAYQALLLSEPESAVSQPLKEAFLAMRQAAESTE